MVLQSIRERLTGILAFVILGILIIPFALVGVTEYFTSSSGNIVARVNDTEITTNDFNQSFSDFRRRMQSILGESYDPLQYDQLMAHWNEVLPGKVLRVQYEDVVQDLETQVRRILDYCDLPFEETCVNFHETERAIRTASSEQVRQPIYNKSVNTWKRFDSHIGDLKEALEPLIDKSDPTIIVR